MLSDLPVMKDDSSLAKNETSAATSSGVPSLLIATLSFSYKKREV